MSVLDRYYIDNIPDSRLKEMIGKHHYLHRLRNCVFSFGLFDREVKEKTFFGEFDDIVGVILYSIPASPFLCASICGDEYSKKVIELSRLWIKDGTMSKVESFMISGTLKMLKDYDIVISYADPSAGHTGIIYQATNFLYTGLSTGGKHLMLKSRKGMHSRHTPGGGYKYLCDTYGKENVYHEISERKHRYVYFSCGKKKREFYMKRLKLEVQPYPKA